MGLYKDADGEARALASYDRTMSLWPVEYEDLWLETDYGLTHAVASGPTDGYPVYLFPGLFADATMWFANVGALAERHRVVCLDQITYGGKSKPSQKPVKSLADYCVWFRQILERLRHTQVAVGGLSYGGWLALALARETPASVTAVMLLDPSETFIKMDGGIAWRGFWHFAFFPSRKKYRRFFEWMGGGYSSPESDTWLEHLLDVIQYGSVGMFDIPQHRIYSADDLRNVTMPTLIVAGGRPVVYKDPARLARAAALALPHAEIEIVEGAGHSVNVEKPEQVNAKLVQFLNRCYEKRVAS